MAQISDSNERIFEAVKHDDGKRSVFRTTNESEWLSYIVADVIEDYGLTERMTFKVEPQRDRWFRIEINFPPDLEPDTWMDIDGVFDSALVGKGWYECRDQGGNHDGSHRWYVVRHKGGGPCSVSNLSFYRKTAPPTPAYPREIAYEDKRNCVGFQGRDRAGGPWI